MMNKTCKRVLQVKSERLACYPAIKFYIYPIYFFHKLLTIKISAKTESSFVINTIFIMVCLQLYSIHSANETTYIFVLIIPSLKYKSCESVHKKSLEQERNIKMQGILAAT